MQHPEASSAPPLRQAAGSSYKPHKDGFPWSVALLGILLALVMTAANVYLGLYAGMTVSASIPAAVVAMGAFRILKRNNIYHSNLVQTMASAGESLAAGIIFTVPALLLVGAWQDFRFWPTTLIGVCGGTMGVLFMIPLRKVLIAGPSNLTYPEGMACARVLEAGNEEREVDKSLERKEDADARGASPQSSAAFILKGLAVGAAFKASQTGLGLLKGTVEWAGRWGERVFFAGSDISPALLAVGFIVRLDIAALIFLGGAMGWLIAIPAAGAGISPDVPALEAAWFLWSTKVRYLGVGAMIVGAVWSVGSVAKGISGGLRSWRASESNTGNTMGGADMSLAAMGTLFVLGLVLMLGLYQYLLEHIALSLAVTGIMAIACFLFAAVSSYITGLVGSSNNPVSGMTISALLGTALLLMALGFGGDSAIVATLGVAAVVCCAACTAGDCSQDLKTGVLIGASPRYQQWAQLLGIWVSALILAPVLSLLHHSYGIGEGLKAPQATLFASLTTGLFGDGELPYAWIATGMGLGILLGGADTFLARRSIPFRLYVMPVAVGIYLPVTLAVPICLGGLIRFVLERLGRRAGAGAVVDSDRLAERGVLLGSGLIAGEALMGVFLALLVYFGWKVEVPWIPDDFKSALSLLAFGWLAWYLGRQRS